MNITDYPTPETDAACDATYAQGVAHIPLVGFMENLERRLAACREVLAALLRYPVARYYPDGPCIDEDDFDAVRDVLVATRPLANLKP